VADGVLPALLVVAVVGEVVHDKLVDLVQSEHLVLRALDRHRDQRDVRVRRLRVGVVAPRIHAANFSFLGTELHACCNK